MKKLFAASVVATVLAASTALAFEPSYMQPIRGTEGPDIRLVVVQHPSLPVDGPEGPDVR